MTKESKLIYYCAVDLHPELECGRDCAECEHLRHAYLCPTCSTKLSYNCDINIETGSLDAYMICYGCGYTE